MIRKRGAEKFKEIQLGDLETTHIPYKLINQNKQYRTETCPQEACKGCHAH